MAVRKSVKNDPSHTCRSLLFAWLCCSIVLAAENPAFAAPTGETSLVNVNPDPNGEPWIAGGITKEQWNAAIADLPPLVLTPRTALGKTVLAPAIADNSIYPAFRPVFSQRGGSCAQASSIAYVFTYEINTLRNLPGNVPDNQYPYDYSYNFLNSGNGENGSQQADGFSIAKALGIPNVTSYGGFGLGKFTQWVSGYNVYFNGMANRVDTQFTIKVNTAAGIATMKEWLSNHGNGSARGGCLVFSYDATGVATGTLAPGTPEAGKKVMYRGGNGGGHAVSVVGYNDSVRYDYNGDGKYTNNIDINSNGTVDVGDWEIGALIMCNSWGTSFGNSGKIYIPYKFCYDDMWGSSVMGMRLITDYTKPLLTYKVTLSHGTRNQIRIRAGYANSASATSAAVTKSFSRAFNYGGGSLPMQGINSDPIEIGLDVSSFLNGMTGTESSLFLIIDSKGGTGAVSRFSLLDYTGGETPVEVVCPQQNVSIVTGTTTLKIVKTLSKLMVLTPNSGEKWEQDRTFPITWFDRLNENVKIDLIKGGAVSSTINASAPSTGTYQWTIPATQAIGADYKIRITSTSDPLTTDMSDNNFSILEKSNLALKSPVGGEYCEKGKPTVISWTSSTSTTIKIDLYKNRIFDTTIAANTPATGSFTWNVPAAIPSGFDYSIRVTASDNTWLYDESANYFAIVNPIVMAPYTQNFNAFPDTTISEYWEQGNDDDLNWTAWKGPTPSKVSTSGGGTGPSVDHTTGTATGKYVYLEASSSNNPGKTGVLLTPSINTSRLTDVQITFWAHLYSRDLHMGGLWMDINTDGTWKDSVLYLTGNHGDVWFQNTVRLNQVTPTTAASPKLLQIRFRGKTGAGYDSDICIDDITVNGQVVSAGNGDIVELTRSRLIKSGNYLAFHHANGMLKIFTINGKCVYSKAVKGSGLIDISPLPEGAYVTKTGGQTLRFVRF